MAITRTLNPTTATQPKRCSTRREEKAAQTITRHLRTTWTNTRRSLSASMEAAHGAVRTFPMLVESSGEFSMSVSLGLTSSTDDRFQMSSARVQQRDIQNYTKERNQFALCWLICVESLCSLALKIRIQFFRLPSWSLIASTTNTYTIIINHHESRKTFGFIGERANGFLST